MVIYVTQAFFLAAMDPLTPLRAALLAGGLNLVGDLWLVNGLGWGIAGIDQAEGAESCLSECCIIVEVSLGIQGFQG